MIIILWRHVTSSLTSPIDAPYTHFPIGHLLDTNRLVSDRQTARRQTDRHVDWQYGSLKACSARANITHYYLQCEAVLPRHFNTYIWPSVTCILMLTIHLFLVEEISCFRNLGFYTVFPKNWHPFTFNNNQVKCWPILMIFDGNTVYFCYLK